MNKSLFRYFFFVIGTGLILALVFNSFMQGVKIHGLEFEKQQLESLNQ